MTIKVVFDDGTVLTEAVADFDQMVEVALAFMDEPGFNNVSVVESPEAGAVPKMRHYIKFK